MLLNMGKSQIKLFEVKGYSKLKQKTRKCSPTFRMSSMSIPEHCVLNSSVIAPSGVRQTCSFLLTHFLVSKYSPVQEVVFDIYPCSTGQLRKRKSVSPARIHGDHGVHVTPRRKVGVYFQDNIFFFNNNVLKSTLAKLVS